MNDASFGLGRLERVGLRPICASESGKFTHWIAHEDRLAILHETIGLSLKVEKHEREVGPFRADILCCDVDDKSWTLIE